MQGHSGTINTWALIAWTLWGLVVAFSLGGWLMWALGGNRMMALLLALTSASIVGPATVAHIRIYAGRVASLVRMTAHSSPDLRRVN